MKNGNHDVAVGAIAHPDLTVSVFLRGDFLRGLAGRVVGAGGSEQQALSEAVEGQIRALYPGASVSVRATDLLDADWEVQIGELGTDRMGGAVRGDIEDRLRAAVGELVSRFR